jgi:predicted TPR repeat methyltransferase
MKVVSREADIAAIFDKGLQAHNAGDLSAAEQLYQETLAINPEHPEANHNIGVVLVAKNELDKALAFFKFALDNSPNVSLFWASYIDTLIKLERIGESKILVKAVKQAGISCDKIEALSQHLDVEHQDPGPKGSQDLNKLLEEQKFDDAIKMCLSLTETYPSSVVLNITLGKGYFELGQIEPAIESFQKAIEINPKCTVGFVMLGQIHSAQGDTDQAIENLKKAIEIEPECAEIRLNMGMLLKDQGKPQAAIESYQRAIEINPNFAASYNNIGVILRDTDDLSGAIKNFKQALIMDPNCAEIYTNLGNVLGDKGDHEAAIEAYQQATKIKPNYAEIYYNMGNALQAKGNLTDAIKSYQRTLHIKPDHAEAYNNMGTALNAVGDYEKAISSYKQAIKIDPLNYDSYYNVGLIQEANDNPEEAIENFEEVLKLDPDNVGAKHILSALTGQQTASAPNVYVEGLFDSYAVRFDQSLVEQLKYNVPKLIAGLVLKHQSGAPLGSIMDLGCGTGLAGVELKDFCQEIEGIDLSKKMLAKARQKNVYSKLNHTSIIEYLAETPLDFDLFLSTDVFVYVGELSEVFRLIKSRNKRHGRLAFSTEHTKKTGFFLEASGRYSHSKSYIDSLCDKFDYQLLNFSTIDLRKSGSKFITGGLYLLEF